MMAFNAMPNIMFRWQNLVILLLLVVVNPTQAQQPSALKISKVIKSENDTRSYRYITLNNTVKALLISDTKAEKSAAALNIRIGSNQNPKQRPGLAHFLEHMLFLGTEKYPTAGEYQKFISQHGGNVNAYTAEENTSYFFDIENAYLEPALDRFAQFFIAPLFDATYIEHEKNAVNAEYLGTINDDDRREWDAYRSLFNSEHPAASFSVGSLATLADSEGHSLRNDLLAFYQNYYSANLMTLVVIGRQPLDELQKMVEARFTLIVNRNKVIVDNYPNLFPADALPISISIKPVKELRKLTFSFPIPHYAAYYQTKPWGYLGHLLGSEASGSLLSLLKSLGWAETLTAGELLTSHEDGLFQISITLTKEGVKAKNQIVTALFENLKMVSARGIVDWRFDELKQMADLEFRFHEKLSALDSVIGLSQAMQDYPAQDVLRGAYTYANFDENLIKQALGYLRKDNAMIALVAPEVVAPEGGQMEVTPYYQTPYTYTVGIPEVLELKSAYRQKLFLPERNIFIPKNTAVKTPSVLLTSDGLAQKNIPTLLMNHDQFKLWFLQDQYYHSPKAELSFRFKLPILNSSLENTARTQLFVALVMDQLNEYTYPARWAGLTFSVEANSRGFDLYVAGYSDKQNLLFNKIIDVIKQASFTQNRFDKIKDDLIREWRNDDKDLPYDVLIKKIPRLQYLPYWGSREYAEALLPISFESFKYFGSKMLTGAKIEAFAYGNLYSQDAIKLAALIEHQLLQKQSDRLPQLAKVLRSENKQNKSWLYAYPLAHKDHAVVLYVQAQSPAVEDAAHMMLLGQILQPDFYNQLRTEKQLGYIVELLPLSLKNVESSVFVVQCPTVSGEEIVAQINTFLANASLNLTANFTNNKSALLSRLREVPVSLTEQAEKYWQSILLNDKEFSRQQELLSAVYRITPESLRAYYEANFLQKNRRLWLSTDKFENLKDFESIQNVADYQQKQQGYLYP